MIDTEKAFTGYKSGQQFLVDRLLAATDRADVTGDSGEMVEELAHLEAYGIQLAHA
jgi:hypothetical protein